MCSLNIFPPPRLGNLMTVCEWENQLVNLQPSDPTIKQLTDIISLYPRVELSPDLLRPIVSSDCAKSAFIEQQVSEWRRIYNTWKEYGLKSALEEIASENEENPSVSTSWLKPLAQGTLTLLKWCIALPGSIFPHLLLSNEDLITTFAQVADWPTSVIRAFAWHPHTVKFAVALRDDSVKVYSIHTGIIPTLKHKSQRGISSMAWKPFSASILAIACQGGILIWQLDPTSVITRPSANCVQVLENPGHHPITSIDWDPHGGLLLSASAGSSSMLLWNIATEENVPIYRMGGGGVSFVRWSPDGTKMFAATPSTLFRVWETQTWTCEVWRNLSSRCQAACWSSDSSVLLFTTKNDPIVYAVTFVTTVENGKIEIGGSTTVLPLINLAEVNFSLPEGNVQIGSQVHSMAWDATGERLAISFYEKENSSFCQRYIAVFRTRLKPLLEITPCGFVQGQEYETPQIICFQKQYDKGAVLTVFWRHQITGSGRVAFIPFYFIPSKSLISGQTTLIRAYHGEENALFSL